ncbi:MAG TPA: prepilin peptidase [Verrucomicrobiae bacterium]|nr:prepilin peptidase [Verrucomicrobiae bacterium]
MGVRPIFDSHQWMLVPFHFWSLVFFTFGCMVGSFLNVCIHRMPLGQSIVFPGSHCPRCQYAIPWYLNIPLLTWIYLRGKCANCKAPIAIRYFFVELLTGLLFLGLWVVYGRQSPGLVLVYCIFIGGLIIATFIDFEHFIIPDEITLGGIVVGFVCSAIVPSLHRADSGVKALRDSFLGIVVGGGLIYLILRVGKLLFGRKKLQLPAETLVVFTETAIVFGDQTIPFEDLFYRKSDTIALEARRVELVDRCYSNIPVRLTPDKLYLGDEVLDPETVPHLEVLTERMVLPQEAMGFGDVKFMAAIGAFLGWQATLFSLMVSSVIGAIVGLTLIVLKKQEWSSRLPYGPYIALAATIWVLGGHRFFDWMLQRAP